jgi:hypothetical protein
MVSAKNDGLSEETGRTHLFGKSWANDRYLRIALKKSAVD